MECVLHEDIRHQKQQFLVYAFSVHVYDFLQAQSFEFRPNPSIQNE